ncbi:MAG: VWA domain-containing protein [Anaerolineaceae bacterium]|nr:VWA domain-containing protein [Anaerolineaceae bacterium]MCB9101409.1 VWA domain-containing protein [Anaerolineales bacterium]
MSLLWPGFLLLLGLIPLIIGGYIWILRRRRRFVVRYSSLALIREALPRSSSWRRHLPFALFLLALVALIVALTRPMASVSVPAGRANIILALDVSRSMCSTDIPPSRLEAAQDAAVSFIQRQAPNTQIGIVAFAGFAELITPPTTDQEVLYNAIESLTTARWTAIGSAILTSLDAIAEINPNVAPSAGPAAQIELTPAPNGVYMSDIIVLLTDGASNQGPLPLAAAQQAVDRGIRVYPIGFGTASGSIMDCSSFGGGTSFGGGFGGGFRRGIDEETLKEIADMTGGTYFSAESAGELQDIFQELPTYLITKRELREISVAFTIMGALLAAMAIGLSLIWHPLP